MPLPVDDPGLARREYATEERLQIRNWTFRNLLQGPVAEDVAFAAVLEARPDHALEVGCGTGEFAERLQREAGVSVTAIDLSPRMVELARRHGVDARLADAVALPFPAGSFDCAYAGWVLYHVRDLDRALAELARVLRPGGRLVAATLGSEDMPELWEPLGGDPEPPLGFTLENGADVLASHFARVECRRVEAVTVFPTSQAVHDYVRATISRSHLAARAAELRTPLRARHVQAVFVAETAL